jgi:hypothetical protein
MSPMRVRHVGQLAGAGLLLALAFSGAAYAAQSSSANYQVNEVFFGSGGALNDCSASYCAKESAGETAVGNTSSTNYQAQAGFNTERTPYLQFVINTGSQNIGTLSTGSTTTATASFSVKAYLSSGYVVQVESPGPANGSYTMLSPSTPTASAAGTEQFGMNLVANTSPVTFGANPNQAPSSAFGYGVAGSNYNTPNFYKFTNGDTIASSAKSSGETDYTISYIFNISNVTPGGIYTLNQVLVATATF